MESILLLQRSILRSELAALEEARAQLLTVESREWLGDARAAYAVTLLVLHADVTRAIEQLRAALADTSRALATMAAR
ncbi:hypothetical protein OH146_08325 [Salinibacterium sp. SYSU T00001]|uniref:hypothetical protein n=1 Tax=Homoserinimonas sedimenticola TaxID=2986805 RepID=UPI00223660C4|nr:hypothetical protein [Salinibacterium sedimenticola]MCW4385780.1 hypothetical protein [Salinibacterium sedimenticola]